MTLKERIIIATKVLGTGGDKPSWKYLIRGSGGKSTIEKMQEGGRIMRVLREKEDAIIVDFSDPFSYFYDHYRLRLQLYSKLELDVQQKEF